MVRARLERVVPLLLLCIAAVPAAAADFRLGVVGGATFQKLNLTLPAFVSEGDLITSKTNRRTGFSAGAALEWGFGDVGTLRLEPRYVQKGAKIEATVHPRTGPNLTVTVPLETAYVDVPLMFRSEFFKKSPTRFYLMSGLGPNFLLTAKSGGDDVKDAFKSVEFGLISCAGVVHNADKVIFMLDFRVAGSITRIDKDGDPKQKVKNAGFQVTTSLIFPKKK